MNHILIFVLALVPLLNSQNLFANEPEAEDPIEVQLGERLFNDDRFSYLYFIDEKSSLNSKLPFGDPSLDQMETLEGLIENPFSGKNMSCAACHMVDQAQGLLKSGVVNYNDFSSRTKIPSRSDGQTLTLRHTSNLVSASLKEGTPLHWDGEFFSAKELSKSSLIGRNMGWKLEEAKAARSHIVQVILEDDGSYMGEDFIEGSYVELLSSFGIHTNILEDEQIFDLVAQFLSDYMMSLDFQRDSEGSFSGSAFDEFAKANNLPLDSEGLLKAIEQKDRSWVWIKPKPLKYHSEPYKFTELELEGLKVFAGRGQCIQCHTPPEFTDHLFHNIGVSQFEYQRKNGGKPISDLFIPNLNERNQMGEKYLVPTEQNPYRLGVFRHTPDASNPELADLGVWNLFAHPDFPHLQTPLKSAVCKSLFANDNHCMDRAEEELLPLTVALFKTPSLRNLGQSSPYFHDGSMPNVHSALVFYMASSGLAKRGRMLNSDPRLKDMQLSSSDFAPLASFLNSLNEDYD